MKFKEAVAKLPVVKVSRPTISALLSYTGMVLFVIAACLLDFMGDGLAVLWLILSVLISSVTAYSSKAWIAEKKSLIIVTNVEELKREDDVLLQGTTFSAAILFFYVNLFGTTQETKLTFSLMIVISAFSFYCVRGIAKVKSSSKLRFYSISLLILLLYSQALTFLSTALQFTFEMIGFPSFRVALIMSGLTVISFAFFQVGVQFSKARYGMEG